VDDAEGEGELGQLKQQQPIAAAYSALAAKVFPGPNSSSETDLNSMWQAPLRLTLPLQAECTHLSIAHNRLANRLSLL